MYTIESCDTSYKCTGVCTQSQFINSLSDFCAAVPQSMLYSIALLFFLASMQLGNLQEEQPTPVGGNDSMYNVLCNLANTSCRFYLNVRPTHICACSPADLSAVFDEVKTLLTTIKSKTVAHRREFLSFRDQIEDDLRSLKDDLSTLNDSVKGLNTSFQEQLTGQQQMASEITYIKISIGTSQSFMAINSQVVDSKLDTLNSKLELLNRSLPQHQQQTASELTQLQTSLTSTNSKLNTLSITTNQLSTDHQQIIEELSQFQTLWKNLTCIQENNVSNTMGPYTCGGTGGWRRVVYLDMTDPSTTCPSGWQLTGHSKRTCERVSTQSPDCDSVTFPVSGGQYSRVCGRIKAYQNEHTDAFEAYHDGDVTTIDGAYVAGVSITHGSPRNHIWTFAAGASEAQPTWADACPCDASITIRVPPFVGNDYFCESGANAASPGVFFPNDPLWDGQNCASSSTCCSFNTPPYFVKQISIPTSDDIEVRLCDLDGQDSPVELIELYVQ